MRNFTYIIVLVFGLQSCNSILFTNAQPEDAPAIQEFPEKILGTFTNGEDSLVIDRTSFVYAGGDIISLSGDLNPEGAVLKKLDDWYLINIPDDLNWWIYPFQISGKDQITVYYSDMNDKEKKIIGKFKKDLKVKEIYQQEKLDYYLISPTKKQFRKLLKKGIFSEKMIFKRLK